MSSVRIVCLSRAVSRITHMGGTAGNEAMIAREPVRLSDGTERMVPWISGNSLRHVSVRAPGMRWLVDTFQLGERLTLAQLNFLFHGGSLTESTGREDTRRIAEMHEAWPLLRLLGGTLPDQINQGALLTQPGILCCEENRDRLAVILGEDAIPDAPLLPAESFVRPYQYATYDAIGREPDLAAKAVGEADPKADPRMLYTGQCVEAGAYFAHDYILRDPTPAEVGAVLWSLELWQRGGGVVGGMSAKGHGRLHTRIMVEGIDGSVPDLIDAYIQTAIRMKDRAVAWLTAAFTRKADKPAKAGKGRKKAAVVEDAE